MPIDYKNVKLGKLKKKIDYRTLQLKDYLTTTLLPPPPKSVDYSNGITDFGMMMNDTIGDCTAAGFFHGVQIWTANEGSEITIPDSGVLALYEGVTGYNPNNPSSDTGAALIDVLNYIRQNGASGQQISAFAEVDIENINTVKTAINIFIGAYIGIGLPVSAQGQQIWDVVGDGENGDSAVGSWGGHCTYLIGYDANYFYVITWGQIMKMTYKFFSYYVDEVYALLSPDYIKNNKSVSGFNLQQLQSDLAEITS